MAKKVWKTSLKRVRSQGLKVRKCLILGLGGGSIVKLVDKLWPKASVVGVDIDPIIVELGKRYLGLEESRIEVVINDACEFIKDQVSKTKRQKCDLICVDLYVGDTYPAKFETNWFLGSIKSLLSENGIAIFNRLYYDEKKKLADQFENKLRKVFAKTERVYPEANVMFLCS
jgi:spermidine synthase